MNSAYLFPPAGGVAGVDAPPPGGAGGFDAPPPEGTAGVCAPPPAGATGTDFPPPSCTGIKGISTVFVVERGTPGVGTAGWTGGVGTFCPAGIWLPGIGMFGRLEAHVKYRDVSMNNPAAAIVTFANGPAAPRGPKTVLDDPPKAAPISAPFPV